jgi:hypothetical protein
MRETILKLFESDTISQQPHLKKIDIEDTKFMKVLSAKPGDINTLLARTSSIIKNDDASKTKGQIITEILEILERSPATRMFVGVGLKSSYHIYKGFPVRYGEKFAKLPDQGQEIEIDQSGNFHAWTTNAVNSRKIATSFDPAKGEPIGGVLADTHIDDSRIFFDVNAVIRTCKIKLQIIRNYNLKAAQGKAISIKNTDFLATEADYYQDMYEIITDINVINTKVVDTWTWNKSTKQPVWKSAQDAKGETNNV